MTTNQYGQPIDDKQHVLKQSEIITEQLKSLERAMYQDEPYGDIKLPLKDLAAYIMDYAHTEWSKSVKHGIALGHKDARVMLEALKDKQFPTLIVADEKDKKVYSVKPKMAIPLEELQKIITALEETV